MLGRTLMQPATPITAGLKIARWAAALHRCRLRLAEARPRALCVQLGGAVGTLDALGASAPRCAAAWPSAWDWPTRARGTTHRDELLRLMAELAIVTATRRQDRARRLAALAGRGRRDAGVAAGEGRGRLERHAAQAQPRGLPAGARRRRAGAAA